MRRRSLGDDYGTPPAPPDSYNQAPAPEVLRHPYVDQPVTWQPWNPPVVPVNLTPPPALPDPVSPAQPRITGPATPPVWGLPPSGLTFFGVPWWVAGLVAVGGLALFSGGRR